MEFFWICFHDSMDCEILSCMCIYLSWFLQGSFPKVWLVFKMMLMLHGSYCEADCDLSLCRLQMIHCLILTSFWPPQCKCLTTLVLHGLGHPFCNHSKHFVLCWPASLNLDSFYTFFSLRSRWYHKLVIVSVNELHDCSPDCCSS